MGVEANISSQRIAPCAQLIVSGVSHQYRLDGSARVQVLSDVSFEIFASQWTAILGPSGCGKTTLLRLMAGLARPSSGRIVHRTAQDEAQKGCALVFQSNNCLPWLRVAQNVAFAVRGQRDSPSAEAVVRDALDAVGLSEYRLRFPSELSGGMQQRVGLARLIATDRTLWMLDEPFSALDPVARIEMRQVVSRAAEAGRRTVILVTHYVEEALRQAKRVIMLGPRPARVKFCLCRVDELRSDIAALAIAHKWLHDSYASGAHLPDPPSELKTYVEDLYG